MQQQSQGSKGVIGIAVRLGTRYVAVFTAKRRCLLAQQMHSAKKFVDISAVPCDNRKKTVKEAQWKTLP